MSKPVKMSYIGNLAFRVMMTRILRRLCMPKIDPDRLRRAVAGDVDAMSQLLREHGPEVEKTLRIEKTWRPYLDAADVMQVTYIEAFRHVGEFDPDRADRFEAWLRQMAENNLRDAIRGLGRQKRGGRERLHNKSAGDDVLVDMAALLAISNSTPSRAAWRCDRAAQVKNAISRLPPVYAEVVRLMDVEARPVAEVAQVMNRSAGAVHMLRARALDRLRELLGPPSAFMTSL